MDNENIETFGNVEVSAWQFGTPCICCGETVDLTEREAHGVCLKLCDECKEAILFAKEMKKSLSAQKKGE